MTDAWDGITVGVLSGGSILALACIVVYLWSKRRD